MNFIFLRNVVLDDVAEALVEICECLEQFFIGLLNPGEHVRQVCSLTVIFVCLQTIRYEFVYLNRVMIFVCAIDCQTQRADQTLASTVGVDAHKCWILVVESTHMWLNKVFEGLSKGI